MSVSTKRTHQEFKTDKILDKRTPLTSTNGSMCCQSTFQGGFSAPVSSSVRRRRAALQPQLTQFSCYSQNEVGIDSLYLLQSKLSMTKFYKIYQAQITQVVHLKMEVFLRYFSTMIHGYSVVKHSSADLGLFLELSKIDPLFESAL